MPPGYAELIVEIVGASGLFTPHDDSLAAHFPDLVPTTREAWCYENGFPIFTFYFQRLDSAEAS